MLGNSESAAYRAPRGFVAYPSQPRSISEVFRRATEDINRSKTVHLTTWEELSVSGKIIIDEILQAIDQRDILLADLTGLNPNVLFELGYAVAQNKRTWLLLDTSITAAKSDFNELRLLTTVGYVPYTNADHITKRFFKEKPQAELNATIFEGQIRPSLDPAADSRLLYLKSLWDTEASTQISKRVSRVPIRTIVDDPKESAFQTLVWYAQNTYAAAGVVCHFTSHNREGARVHNAKQAFVSGLAFGFAKPLLMLAEDDYLSPVDYRDLLKNYGSSSQAVRVFDDWIRPIETLYLETQKTRVAHASAVKLATELSGFLFGLGDYIAENESERLDQYFVETTAYREALEGRQAIFIGRKGTGKSANLLKLASVLEENPSNLVVKITPVAYEIDTLVNLFTKLQSDENKGYVIEALWKFLIYTEMANAAVQVIESRPIWTVATDAEKELVRIVTEEASVVAGDFSVRLERAINSLLPLRDYSGIENARIAISEALHQTILGKLRVILGRVLAPKQRVAVLVDNLDKPWTKQADIEQLSEFLLGLLTVGSRIAGEFKKEDQRREAVNVSSAVFLRADIFSKVLDRAREPDKIFYTRLDWDDPELLLRVIEERYEASHKGHPGNELWDHYFCRMVKGIPIKEYLLSRILPRPRDIVYLVKAAVANAVNRRHARVEVEDVLSAEPEYSQYAVKSILVENGVTLPELEAIMVEFAGADAILTQHEVRALVLKALGDRSRLDYAVSHLIGLTFLGLQTREGEFDFVEDYGEFKKSSVLAKRLSPSHASQLKFKINPAFHAYLEIKE